MRGTWGCEENRVDLNCEASRGSRAVRTVPGGIRSWTSTGAIRALREAPWEEGLKGILWGLGL